MKSQQETETCESLPGRLTAELLCQEEDRLDETLVLEESEIF